jgi:ABC-type nitrate/sulfonate/bicarbonate transport system ATPase subunit
MLRSNAVNSFRWWAERRGKTTFLRIVAGLELKLRHHLLDGRASAAGRRPRFVFQSDNLLPWRTIFSNAIIGPEVAGRVGDKERQRTLICLLSARRFETITRASFRRHAPTRQSRARARHRSVFW